MKVGMNFHFDCSEYLLQRRRNKKLLRRPCHTPRAAHSAYSKPGNLNVTLPPSCELVHGRDIPFAATRALKA
jgi:hypothetical protein